MYIYIKLFSYTDRKRSNFSHKPPFMVTIYQIFATIKKQNIALVTKEKC